VEFPSKKNPLKLNSTDAPLPSRVVFPSGPPKSGSLESIVAVAVDIAVTVDVVVPIEVDVGVAVKAALLVEMNVAVEVYVAALVVEVGVEVKAGFGFDVDV
jgi:hypothetical protein